MIRIVSAALVAALAFALTQEKKKVFVSYYYEGDRHYKRLLKAWSANRNFDLEFEDYSVDVSIKSDNEAYLRRRITEKIAAADVFLVLIGEKSHERKWVSWEIAKAKELGRRLVAVKARRNYLSPKDLLSAGVTWVYGFNAKNIQEAIKA